MPGWIWIVGPLVLFIMLVAWGDSRLEARNAVQREALSEFDEDSFHERGGAGRAVGNDPEGWAEEQEEDEEDEDPEEFWGWDDDDDWVDD